MNQEQKPGPQATQILLSCTHDTNGNPRRIYQVSSHFVPGQFGNAGHFKRTIYVEDGYSGRDSARGALEYLGVSEANCADLGSVLITPGEYRELRKMSDYFSGPEECRRRLATIQAKDRSG